MKIAFFHNLPTGGAKRVVYEEIKRLSKKHTVDLYTIHSFENDFLDFSKLSYKEYVYDFSLESPMPNSLKRLIRDFKTFVLLPELHKKIAYDIDKKKYDVVIVHPDRFTQAPYLLKYLRTKSIYFCEELLRMAYEPYFSISDLPTTNYLYELSNRKIRKYIDKSNARSASVILANSNFTKEKAEKAYQREVFTCYLGVDTNAFKPSKEKKEFLLFIGNPDKVTGLDLLDLLRMRYKDIGKRIKIIDFSKEKALSDRELAIYYSKSFATLCLSFEEPFGLTPLESMSTETPVIAVDEGGYKESIINNKTGFLLQRNTKEIYEKIIYLIRHPDRRMAMGKNGRIFVKEQWTWENHVKDLQKYF